MKNIFHVVIVGSYVRDQQLSMQKFAELMSKSLAERRISADLLCPTVRLSRLASGDGMIAKWLGYVDKFVLFSHQLRQHLRSLPLSAKKATLVHICDHSNSLYVDHVCDLRHVVTCHDMIAVRQSRGEMHGPPVRWTGRKLQQLIVRGMRRAEWVACDSNTTHRDLLACSGRVALKTETIYCQLNHPYAPLPRENAWTLLDPKLSRRPGALILHVGNNSWYKNRDGVLKIFAQARKLSPDLRARLVVVGREFTPTQQAYIAREGLTDVVDRVSDLSETELQAAYSVADVFLFPSLYEGFGWPPIEAQACGCPVVAGTGGSLGEVIEDSALTAVGKDEGRLAVFVTNLLRNESLREKFRARGLRNVERFRAPRMIDEYVNLYKRILETGDSFCGVGGPQATRHAGFR